MHSSVGPKIEIKKNIKQMIGWIAFSSESLE